ncbi:MAG: hypothetical protein IPJ65_09165 [Archangiaceae bacterium]|nr:hypothetical protein [Archangiaceae bacterium]
MISILVASLLAVSVQDFVEGAEVGTAEAYVALESKGKYHAEKIDKAAGKTVLKGTWKMKDTGAGIKENGLDQKTGRVEVKIASCAGPACKELKKDYTLDVELQAERAMTVKSTPPDSMFPTGSYYCRYQGCEKRTGVELLSKEAKPRTMNWIVDFMIDKNRKRDVTVVWWGKKLTTDAGKTRIEYCPRDGERGKKGAELVAADLAELPWLGKIEAPVETAEKDCLFDVRVYIADDVAAPEKKH